MQADVCDVRQFGGVNLEGDGCQIYQGNILVWKRIKIECFFNKIYY